jgi:hypothetical protein
VKTKVIWIFLIIIFFIAGAAGSYFLMKYLAPAGIHQASEEQELHSTESQDLITVRLLLPKNQKLEMTERKFKKRMKSTAFAEAVVEEFFKEAGNTYAIPQQVKLLGIYRDINQILYIDFSDELRRNFQGDALDEYLLLKGLYESLVSNVQDFQDLKVLVEGKEIETLGGHLLLKYPLKSLVTAEPKPESMAAYE